MRPDEAKAKKKRNQQKSCELRAGFGFFLAHRTVTAEKRNRKNFTI